MAERVLYLRGRSEEQAEVVRAFETAGFEVGVLRAFEQVLEQARRRPFRALVIDASSDNAEVAERLVELSSARELHEVPIVFIGRLVTERTHVLKQQFQRLLAIDYPYDAKQFSSKVRGLFLDGGSSQSSLPVIEAGGLVRTYDPLQLRPGAAGEFLRNARDLSAFDDELLLPKGDRRGLVKGALQSISEAAPHLATHARRSSFVATAASSKFAGDFEDVIRTGSLLLQWGAVQAGERLADLTDTLKAGEGAARKAADLITESAVLVRSHLGDGRTAGTLDAIASILTGRSSLLDPGVRRAAESIFLTEAAEQHCWKSGSWDRNGAHRAVQFVRTTPLSKDAAARLGVGRVLGEAVLGDPQSIRGYVRSANPKDVQQRKRKLQQAQDAALREFRTTTTKSVRIFELMPGMRTAEPLATLDGQVVVPSNTVLDLDLLLRVFQLAAVRPMRERVSIVER